ncbi:MAG: type II toxin-antitoxin system PemK/MazF family toxin [Lachnospiraceae bacterium]|nr:type II toxin-antitoxin system PemK/MazF family toxin [Lachnospiraceae bacterium]
MRVYSRGDVYYANLSPVIGSEQAGYRPVLIIQNNTGNRYGRTVIVASLSSQSEHKPKLPTHCYIQAGDILKKSSVVMLEQLRTIDKQRLDGYIGSLDQNYMEEIDKALAVSVGLAGR